MSSGLLPCDDDWGGDDHDGDGDAHNDDGGDHDDDGDDHEEEEEVIVGVDGKSDCHNSTDPPVVSSWPTSDDGGIEDRGDSVEVVELRCREQYSTKTIAMMRIPIE